jgi:hypothetical protein
MMALLAKLALLVLFVAAGWGGGTLASLLLRVFFAPKRIRAFLRLLLSRRY